MHFIDTVLLNLFEMWHDIENRAIIHTCIPKDVSDRYSINIAISLTLQTVLPRIDLALTKMTFVLS